MWAIHCVAYTVQGWRFRFPNCYLSESLHQVDCKKEPGHRRQHKRSLAAPGKRNYGNDSCDYNETKGPKGGRSRAHAQARAAVVAQEIR